ncbi:HNH endonuclease [Actinoplanes sp. TRM 88003]|uniref:HNH endonuclease n=1 Tax=Paractinoplanes aksuensis TaxID=2939490 RepID=A0ABT1DVQ1_9ACTN|nr:HNH endonuclease signature motif containing protein [Actinoplanes aksuensis]MCO8274913.1 HNH endonuclease [Actinoplanes aksuensis]
MLAEVQQISEDAAKLAAAPLWSLSDEDIVDGLRTAYRLEQIAVALQARLVRQAEVRGHQTTPRWLRSHLLIDRRAARELGERAAALARHPEVEQALLDGRVDTGQATVITATIDTVATELAEAGDADADGRVAHDATTAMIELAERLPPLQLRRVGERILAHVAPQLAERTDELALTKQEERAHRARGFTLSAPVAGVVRLSGSLGVEDAALVRAALDPLCAPIVGDERNPAQRRADALAEVCRLALRTGELPATGGEPAQLSVTVAFDPLTQALGTATTDDGVRLSAESLRRLACDAKILPAVLGGAGQVLDLGRSQRLPTGTVRRALHLRDRGCAFPDCDRPPRWTDAHHVLAWTEGGATCLGNLVLLCRRHHRLIHHPTAGWQIRLGADGQPEFIPPPDVDPARVPRRNLYHLRL